MLIFVGFTLATAVAGLYGLGSLARTFLNWPALPLVKFSIGMMPSENSVLASFASESRSSLLTVAMRRSSVG